LRRTSQGLSSDRNRDASHDLIGSLDKPGSAVPFFPWRYFFVLHCTKRLCIEKTLSTGHSHCYCNDAEPDSANGSSGMFYFLFIVTPDKAKLCPVIPLFFAKPFRWAWYGGIAKRHGHVTDLCRAVFPGTCKAADCPSPNADAGRAGQADIRFRFLRTGQQAKAENTGSMKNSSLGRRNTGGSSIREST